MQPSLDVLNSCYYVSENASFVSINREALIKFSEEISRLWPSPVGVNEPFHRVQDPEKRLWYIFILDTINFGSGYKDPFSIIKYGGGYTEMAERLRDAMEQGFLGDTSSLIRLTPDNLAKIMDAQAGSPLLIKWTKAINALGHTINEKFDSRYLKIIELANNNSQRLISTLVNIAPFNDIALYNGQKIFFYKKAQIVAADLYFGFSKEGHGFFDDIDLLTIMADNMIPHVLAAKDVLQYTPELKRRIALREKIPSCSQYEIEIRAHAIVACDQILHTLEKNWNKKLLSIELDRFLWELSQTPFYKQSHAHITETIFY